MTFDKRRAREAIKAFNTAQLSALAVAGHLPGALDRIDALESAAVLCAEAAVGGLATSSPILKVEALADVRSRLHAVLGLDSATHGEAASQHQGKIEPWSADELKAHLATLVDGLLSEGGDASPLDVALKLLGGELEAFVLFGRVGHLDPPRPDGKVPIAVLQCRSEDPQIDAAIREAAKKWAADQENRA